MLISTRGRYALRVMVDIAENGKEGYIAMKDVAARQEISLKYIERILPVLVTNGLLSGVHGKGGGYKLTRDPSEYTLQEILKLTGDLNPMGCLENGGKPCSRSKDCRTRPVWDKLNTLLNDYLKGVTIKDLMKE
ncbi:MAG: Rrf2 family transcriptional regulator [Clostridia bacterium]|nr:Rrf2 family transcriptional regulator [Clostridia bacterium]